jgi:hypothetical protein
LFRVKSWWYLATASKLSFQDIDETMKREDARPSAMEWRPLDLRSYAAALPGTPERRVTTSGQVFDDHVESHEFFSPGGRLFDGIAREEATLELSEATTGVCWRVRTEGEQQYRFVVMAPTGHQEIKSLKDLLQVVKLLGPPREPPEISGTTRRSIASFSPGGIDVLCRPDPTRFI